MKFTTLIPTTRNDGSPVTTSELKTILDCFWAAFGACTVEGKTDGYWVDGGTPFQDECLKVVVSCENDRLAEAESLVRDVGKQLGQLAMYFEVQYFDGVRIIRCD